jgi:hypothetical protein
MSIRYIQGKRSAASASDRPPGADWNDEYTLLDTASTLIGSWLSPNVIGQKAQ